MIPGFQEILLDEFGGLLTLPDLRDVPAGFSPGPCENVEFLAGGGWRSRPGTAVSFDLGAGTEVVHMEYFNKSDSAALYFLALMDDGKIYWSNGVAGRTLIYTPPAGTTHFRLVTYGNRTYILTSNGQAGNSEPEIWDGAVLDLATILPEPNILDRATATLTSTGVNVTAGDTVTIGIPSFSTLGALNFVYTFVATLTAPLGLPGEVLIGANAAASLANLYAAINLDPAGVGSTYGIGTLTSFVLFRAITLTATTIVVEAQQSGASQNGITTTEAAAELSWGGATFAGGSKFDAADGVQGNCNVGYHALRVVFETRSGYISSPTDYRVALVRTDQATIPVSGVPTWTPPVGHVAAECTKRHIIMTPGSGDPADLADLLNPLTFMIAVDGTYHIALTINDNTTTTGTINISDAQLVNQTEATEFFQHKSPAPSGMAGVLYHERLVLTDGTSRIWVSEPGFPHTFRTDVSFIDVFINDGQKVTNMYVIRDVLYIVKEQRLYYTEDNGDDPATWPVGLVSDSVGTASIYGVDSNADDQFAAVLDFKGLYILVGGTSSSPISLPIQPDWDGQTYAYMHKAMVKIDPLHRRILCFLPTAGVTTPNRVLVADYKEGLARIKWSAWTAAAAGMVWRGFLTAYENFQQVALLVYGVSSKVRKFDTTKWNDDGAAFTWTHRFGHVKVMPTGLNGFGGVTFKAVGGGNLSFVVYGPDGASLVTPAVLALAAAPGKNYHRNFNIVKDQVFLELSQSAPSAVFIMNRWAGDVKVIGPRLGLE